jgi:hypothetical protein
VQKIKKIFLELEKENPDEANSRIVDSRKNMQPRLLAQLTSNHD